MFKKYLLLPVLVIGTFASNAQSSVKPAPVTFQKLAIGDKLPEVVLNNLLNHKHESEKLSAFNNDKYLIIDFFATWCLPCVRALPDLNALQEKLHDRLQVVVVSQEEKNIVARFLQNNKTVQGISLPFATKDSLLSNMFPHRIVPHEIWIDREGVVKAITSAEEINEKNIMAFVNNQPLTLPVKKDVLDFNPDKPLFVNGNGGTGNDFLARSIMTKRMDGMSSRTKIDMDPARKISRAIYINAPSFYLFFSAYSRYRQSMFNLKRVVFNNKDSVIVNSPGSDMDRLKKLLASYDSYCYELSLPEAAPDSVFFGYMLEDLNRYFPISGKVEKRTIPCWVLTRTSHDDALLQSKGGKISYPGSGKMRNVPLSNFTYFLNQFFQIEPVIDETGFMKPVDMDLSFSRNVNEYPDIASIRKDLNKYGLDLLKQPRTVDILVISDK